MFAVCGFFTYATLFYNSGDPRDIDYILWKGGLYRNINLKSAIDAFYLDPDRDQLIKGATEDQLRIRFGYVRPLEQMSPYYQQCRDQDPTRKARTVVFIRDMAWMVVMDNQRGSELVLCKGY
jgi:hypothetical protein